jgi:DNA polymerase elongation subunit (family B)
LKHKDVKFRRRAVRHLFEDDNPRALKGFVALLNDKDPWFRNKSLDAHRKWAKNPEDLVPLMDSNQRIAGELLEKIDAPEIAKLLLENTDHLTRSFAAKSLAIDTDLHEVFANDSHYSIRIVAANNSVDVALISSLIQDPHSSVRRAAIATASREGLHLDDETLERGLSSSDPSLRSLIASLAVKNGGDMLERACMDSNPKVRKAIADTLRNDVEVVDDRINLIAEVSPDIIVRWLRSRHDSRSTSLRWSMIQNSKLNSRTRSKLIEQMEGRNDIDQDKLSVVSEDSSILVRLAANNLSASVSELAGEDS